MASSSSSTNAAGNNPSSRPSSLTPPPQPEEKSHEVAAVCVSSLGPDGGTVSSNDEDDDEGTSCSATAPSNPHGSKHKCMKFESNFIHCKTFTSSDPFPANYHAFSKQSYILIDYPEPWPAEMRQAFLEATGYDLDEDNGEARVGGTGRPLAPDAPEKKFVACELREDSKSDQLLLSAFAADDRKELHAVELAFVKAKIGFVGDCSWVKVPGSESRRNFARWYKHDEREKSRYIWDP